MSKPPAVYVGIDVQSAGLALGFWSPDRGYTSKVVWIALPSYAGKLTAARRYERLAVLSGFGVNKSRLLAGAHIYVERPYGQSRNTQSTLMQLSGALMGGLHAAGFIDADEINTSTWKLLALGPEGVNLGNRMGGASKPEVMYGAKILAPHIVHKRQDTADALMIAYGGYLRDLLKVTEKA